MRMCGDLTFVSTLLQLFVVEGLLKKLKNTGSGGLISQRESFRLFIRLSHRKDLSVSGL